MQTSHNDRAGYTMLEMVISVTLLSLILGGVVSLGLAGSGAFKAGVTTTTLDNRVRQSSERLAKEIAGARRGTLIPDPQPIPGIQGVGTSTLDFEQNVGFAAGAIQWGPRTRVAFEYEAGELNNGADDDGDGLIDEGAIVMTVDPGSAAARRTVLATGVSELLEGETANGADDNGNGLVDESGLVFDLDGTALIIRASLERMQNNRRIVRTIETSVLLRN